MGDEAVDPDLASAPAAQEVPVASRKRPRSGDLKRAAEIVMVLSVMGRMRGGREPTPAERALVAEARDLLTGVCEEVKPKDLFSSDAVRVVVDDLGLNRSQDPVLGFRPLKMSIGEKLLHTKKKMEESKELATVYSSQPLPVGVGANSDPYGTMLHGAPRFLPDRPNSMQLTTGIYQSSSPLVHAPELDLTIPSLKQQQNETQPASTLMKSSTSSLGRDSHFVTLSHTEAAQFRLDTRATHPQALASAEYAAIKNPIVPVQATSAVTMKLGETNKLLYHTQVKSDSAHVSNSIQSSYQVMRSQDTQSSLIQSTPGNLLIGHQPSQPVTYVHAATFFGNHSDIANSILGVLQQKPSDPSHWTPPSIDYINKPINCQICKTAINDVDSLVVCDACEKGTHLKCLQASYKGISKTTEWHCPKCLLANNGKPLGPKYGRVTRSSNAPRASANTVKTPMPSEKRAENADSNSNHHKLMPNGNSGFPNLAHGSNLTSVSSVLALDSKVTSAEGTQLLNVLAAEIKSEDGKCTGTATYQSKVEDGVVCASTGIQIGNFDRRNNGLPLQGLQKSTSESLLEPMIEPENSFSEHQRDTTEITNQFQEPHDTCIQIKNSGRRNSELSIQDLQKSTSESLFEPKIVSENSLSEHQSDTSKITNQFQNLDGSKACHRMEVTLSVEVSANQLDEICKQNSDELKPCKGKETVDNQSDCDVGPDDQVNSSSTPNGSLCNGDAAIDCRSPSLLELHPMDWVGDILETVDERTYYRSCHVNGALHNLQDHVLISRNDTGLFPSKLQSLWEDKKTRLRWATVDPYYFPKDLPETVYPPSTPENREVYASKTRSTILACSINGPCEVLPIEKFQEETDRRTHLKDTSGLHPLFLCKWLYDESKNDEDDEGEGGLSKSEKELKKLLGEAAGADESDAEDDDADDEATIFPVLAPKDEPAENSPLKLTPGSARGTPSNSKPSKSKGKPGSHDVKTANGAFAKKMKVENDSKSSPVKVKPPFSSKTSVPLKGFGSTAAKSGQSTSVAPVTENKIRSAILERAQTTQELVSRFKPRIKTQQDKESFTEILRRISRISRKNGSSFLMMKE